MRKAVILTILMLSTRMGIAQNGPSFQPELFEHSGRSLPYQILYPTDFDPAKKYPLHLFLHGAGERGDDNQAQLVHGSSLFLEKSEEYPAIVIFPQCPKDDYWAAVTVSQNSSGNVFMFPDSPSPRPAMEQVIALMDQMVQRPYIDEDRVYVSGLSMGGMGTYELLYHRPKMFAAAAAICGGIHPKTVSQWAQSTPIWIFHGEEDQVVPIRNSKIVLESLLKERIEPKINFYPGVNHSSWDNAFAEPDFLSWHYNQVKSQPAWNQFTEAALLTRYDKENKISSTTTSSTNRMVFMGNSITEGWLSSDPIFWKEHPSYINRGVGGQTTPQMLLRFRQDVIELQPKAVVILAGTNDIAGNTGTTSLQTIASNIFTMADLASKNGIAVYIASVLPAQVYPWRPGLAPASKIVALNELLKEFATSNGHAYIDFHSAMKNSENGLQQELTTDGVHLTKEGYAIMQKVLQESMK